MGVYTGGGYSLPGRVVATGQTTCYSGNTGSTTSCTGASGTGQDSDNASYGLAMSYTNGISGTTDGTVTDNNTGLMWIKQPELIIPGATGVTASNQINAAKGNWTISTSYVPGNLVFAQQRDTGVTATQSTTTVTASSGTPFTSDDIGRVLLIGATNVGTILDYTSSTVVTVSTSQTISTPAEAYVYSYYVCGASSNCNSSTGTFAADPNFSYWRETMWTGSAGNLTTPSTAYWSGAIKKCQALATAGYAGYTDWRLPNIKELFSIVVEQGSAPFINQTYFPNTVSNYYWSSTTYPNSTTSAFAVYFYNGYAYTNGKTNAYYIRCVRGQ